MKKYISIHNGAIEIPAILWSNAKDKVIIAVHGDLSNKEDAIIEVLAKNAIPKGYCILSFDLPEHGDRKNDNYECNPQNCTSDIQAVYFCAKSLHADISVFACSIGVYFCLLAFQNLTFNRYFFLSPVLDMERLIQNMMKWSNISEKELQEKAKIKTSFGKIISWDYYQYVRHNPIKKWNSKTFILCGENDNLTEKSILNSFSMENNCSVDIMKNGEHYFHTKEQLDYLNNWLQKVIE